MELATQPMSQWSGVEGRPLVISGPCSAESEAQVMETARRLSALRVDYFRAGIWKARTRPSTFEGIGETALPWLRCAGATYGMKTATEVATARHVELALENGIDLLWIGARTTVNPFSVQEIATALRGTSVPVLIKNPTSPDLALWLGAVERVYGAGVRALGVIHRGFTTAGQTRFRNTPMWDRAIEFRRMLPDVPILADPSHICGRRDLLLEIAQTAMDLGLDGLMIESHPNPDQAWSDATQQITPERLGELLARMVVPAPGSNAAAYSAAIEALRDQIDHVDRELLDLLGRRMQVVDQIARCKKDNNVTALQVERWRALLDDRVSQARSLGLSADYARALYEIIHVESVRRQSALMHAGDEPADTPPPDATA
ncbi:MAG TPA: chorismate mutase [Gemmatimonadaceae bacterium]|nr:chorismate mutase [Gemmatimonadaceae bacterium]